MQHQLTNKVHRPSTTHGRMQRRVKATRSIAGHIKLQEAARRAENWQQRAVSVYQHVESRETDGLEMELVRRIEALTGRTIAAETIYVNRSERIAVVNVDGVTFRLTHHRLAVLAPCSHCGVGQFESPAIKTVRDLGYALSDWQPLCSHCTPEDPAGWLDSDY